jgi:hypothetical protein
MDNTHFLFYLSYIYVICEYFHVRKQAPFALRGEASSKIGKTMKEAYG